MEQRGESEVMFPCNRTESKSGESPYTDLSRARPGWSSLLILAGISTTLGLSMPVGYNIGVVNTPADIIKNFSNVSIQTRYDIEINQSGMKILWSCIVSVFLIGATAGSLGGSILANKMGRKGVLAVCAALSGISAVSFISCKAANSLELLACGRILAGLSAGLTTSVVPMYLMELAPLHLKGAMGVLCPLGVTIGVLVGQIVSMKSILGNEDSWPLCLAAFGLPLIVASGVFPFLPESPKYLYVICKQSQRALRELEKLRNINIQFLDEDVRDLKRELEDDQKTEGMSWNIWRVVKEKALLLPLLLVCALQAGQQLSGINAVFYYSNEIFKTAGLSSSASELATIGAGCCNFAMAVISIPLISTVNRRCCIQISIALSVVFLIILGIAIIFIHSFFWVPYISIVGILGYVISYGIGLGPIPYFVGSELFEVGPRPSAMALGSLSNWGANLIIGLSFPILQLWIGATCFFIFAAITLALFVFLWFYLPETRGRDSSEVAKTCKDGFRSKPLSIYQPENSLLGKNIQNKSSNDTYI